MKQKTSDPKGDQPQCRQNGQSEDDVKGHGNPEGNEHDDHNAKGYKHLKAVYTHFYQQKDVFGKIDFGNYGLVLLDDAHALQHGLVEKIPKGDANENKYGKIFFSCRKNGAENKVVDEHEAQRLQDPPQPVQIRIGNFRFQLRFGRINGILPIFIHISLKFFIHKTLPGRHAAGLLILFFEYFQAV